MEKADKRRKSNPKSDQATVRLTPEAHADLAIWCQYMFTTKGELINQLIMEHLAGVKDEIAEFHQKEKERLKRRSPHP